MPSSALRSFTQAFSASYSIQKAASIPIYLAPATARKLPPGSARSKRHPSEARLRNASVATPVDSPSNATPLPPPGMHGLPIKAEEAIHSPQRWKDPSAWATLIEAYLPPHLRLKSQSDLGPVPQAPGALPIGTFYLVLSRARAYAKTDLLRYLGVYQDRWDAVIWLVKAMLEQYPSHTTGKDISGQVPNLLWPSAGQRLDTITGNAIATVAPQPSKLSLEQFVSRGDLYDHPYGVGYDVHIGRKILGQIWQTLGTMILQAADRPPEDPSYSAIMSHVFQILAHLHHIDAFPNSIYNFTLATDPTVLQRPPTLYLLSKRIMSILSDLEWALQWEEEILKYQKQGYDLSKVSVQPRIREFGPELWLDLVLWACVEGGWVTEGAWIVGEMERRKGTRETQWSVISWQEICAVKAPKFDWTSFLRLQIDRTRLNQVGGIGIATGTDSTVDMGTRTISREVVLALIDGLINTASLHTSGHASSSVGVQQSIATCKKLLERDRPELDPNFQNATIIRIMESANENSPGILQRLLDLRLSKPKSKGIDATASMSAQDYDTDDAASILGLLYRVLHCYAREGNLQASLACFMKIQNLVDDKRGKCIEDFAKELRDRLRQGEDTTDLVSNKKDSACTIHPDIPINTMVAFLDLITQSNLYNLGQWLLFNDDIDGGIIDPELYSNPNVQPALLRFATATADNRLLTKVLERLEAPLSEPVLHALLRCQVALGKLDAVEELLGHFQKTPGMAWRASDATSIARAILQMDHHPTDSQNVERIAQALEMLQKIIHGRYNSDHDASQLPNLTETKLANQLGRIFKTLPGSLSKITTDPSGDFRAHASATVTPNAFNIILESIVQHCGSIAGKQLWEQWCLIPGNSRLNENIRKVGGESYEKIERVVTPTLYMLRNVLRPIIEKRRRTSSAKSKKPLEASSPLSDDHPAQSKMQSTHDNGNTAEHTLSPRPGEGNGQVVAGPVKLPDGSVEENEKHLVSEEERDVLAWCIRMYKKFGLSEKAINAEIPGSFQMVKRAELPL
ncbi:hypothetical protein OEA41_010426 [Lepraria neglecta]|uniref:Uncharacterized protein n=1 Tax=Lepraria neglecta TaxID=209136 RepID=A0AAD9YWL0_9LECA|nr:hypothetical protein OEA41_010426 [Lepraria neglecta]